MAKFLNVLSVVLCLIVYSCAQPILDNLNATDTLASSVQNRLSFLDRVSQGISLTRQKFANAQVYLVIASTTDGASSDKANEFIDLDIETTDYSRTRTFSIKFWGTWRQPQLMEDPPPTQFPPFNWPSVPTDLPVVFDRTLAAGHAGPWKYVWVFRTRYEGVLELFYLLEGGERVAYKVSTGTVVPFNPDLDLEFPGLLANPSSILVA